MTPTRAGRFRFAHWPCAARHNARLVTAAVAVCVGGLTLAALLGAAGDAVAGPFTPDAGGSPNAGDIDTLYRIAFYIGIVVFLVVEGTLIFHDVPTLSLWDGLRAVRLKLWDEGRGRLVTFAEASAD